MDDLTELHREQAWAASDRGDFEESIRHWRAVIAAQPTDAIAHYNLGVDLNHAGQPEQAGMAFQEAAGLDPGMAEPQYSRALLACKARQWDKMATLCRRAEALRPGWRTALFGAMFAAAERAKQTRRTEDWREALAAVDYGLSVRPDLVDWRHERAYCLWQLGRRGKAVEEMEALVGAEPTYKRYVWLAHYQLRSGRLRDWWGTQRLLWPKALSRVDWERSKRAEVRPAETERG